MTNAPTPTMPPMQPGWQAPTKRAEGLALAAMICGICGFVIPIAGLVGLILGIIAIAKKTTKKGMATAGVVTGAVGMVAYVCLIFSILLPGLSRARELACRVACQNKLKLVATGLALYRNEYEAWPENLNQLAKENYMGSMEFKCPSAHSDRDCDYFYFPPRLSSDEADPKTIVVCEYKSNHEGGRNVGYVDMKAKWLDESEFQEELKLPCNAEFAAALRAAEGG